ncbi:MAG: immunity 41 family protein [Agarilytica sp.]
MKNLLRNFPHCKEYSDDSFTGIWHEQARWDEAEYWLLDKCIYDLSEKYLSEEIPRKVAWPLARIFSYIMMSIQAHYNSNDGFEIESLDDEMMFKFRERFQIVVEGFFKGDMPKNTSFGIVNPLLS